ncbi:hypothetical protein PVNG_05833 [Plasmodium vivax North Korean]|uniref:Fam-l protein n=1 Tax=Plasmodium vivax North Korean TaxID=1035514 RepID=A0A0J9TL72_PLAVI|nr:hypothetical protein PVNG_05833 [Plasmodium vivax North Korean]
MGMLENYNIGKNVNFTIFLKKFTFFFLILSHLTYNDMSPFCKSLENIYKQDRTLSTKFNRILARHDQLRELERTRRREKLPDRRPYTEKINVHDNIKTYSHVKRNESNNIDVYMKNYKHRYGKKKGLSKLDCYYENKVFRKFCDISDISKKMKYDEERSKKFFLKKYGVGIIIFALIPALGLIFPILFGISNKLKGILDYCLDAKHTTPGGNHEGCSKIVLAGYEDIIDQISYVPLIFSFLMIIIVLLNVIYILIKVIKYEKIKAGKGKICAK